MPRAFTLRGLKVQLQSYEMAPGATLAFDVVFLPTEEGLREGTLTLVASQVEMQLDLRGVGTLRQLPQLAVEPSALDFGSLPVGATDRRTVTLRNEGTADATVRAVRLGSSGGDATRGTVYAFDGALPLTVPAGGTATADVRFAPSSAATFTETLQIEAGLGAPLALALRGRGEAARGDLACAPPSVDFGDVERGATAQETVSCTARGGPVRVVRVTSSAPAAFALARPVAGVDVESGARVDIPVTFSAQGAVGARTARLEVAYEDATGPSTQTLQMRGRVTEPPPSATAISLELRWDTNQTDVDLHLTAPGGAPFFRDDCYFGERRADWGVPGDRSDDCFLDVDDVDGFGPERINVSRAEAGTYRVYVHYFADRGLGPSEATVDVSVGGTRAGSFSRTLMRCGEMWLVGEIQWNGTSGSFRPVDRVELSLFGDC
jgi:uncharacterized protein YfaP (DUF2135 family)